MKTKNSRTPVALMIITLFILATFTLTACGGQQLPNVNLPAFGPTETATTAPTATPTEFPAGAQQAAENFVTTFGKKDSGEKVDDFVVRMCALSTWNGCNTYANEIAPTVAFQYKTYEIKTEIEIKGATLVEKGLRRDANVATSFQLPADAQLPYEVWRIEASYTRPWPGVRKDISPNVRMIWSGKMWLFDGFAPQATANQ
jgi:hypothetical protein